MAKAIVAGGSIGGLFAAAALLQAGWEVDLFERSQVELSGRGAGIVTHPPLIAALEGLGAQTADLGVGVTERVAFDLAGQVVARLDYPQIVTSWDRMYQILRPLVPSGSHHLGAEVVGYDEQPGAIRARLADGTYREADLLVGADGFRSAVRGQFCPDVTPDYAGYVVWRALAHEADVPQDVHAAIFAYFGLFAPYGAQILGYPIAGPNNDLRAGHRRYNFVWYAQTDRAALDAMLTDATGRLHDVSIPPPLVRDAVLDEMRAAARDRMPAPFRAVLEVSERPFFTPIYDHHSPRMGAGRVALAGDAACVARPHVGMGVTKAAFDALALARCLDAAPTVESGLAAYSAERVAAAHRAYAAAQWLGAQLSAGGAGNRDGRSHPRLAHILAETATVVG